MGDVSMFKKFFSIAMFLVLLLTLTPQLSSTSYAASVVEEVPQLTSSSHDASVTDVTYNALVETMAVRATYPNGLTVEGGDVLVTNNTSSSGLTGHAGIVTDANGNIASIAGYGAHPELTSLSAWFRKNPNTVVVRNSDASLAHSAGSWAKSYVAQHSNAKYGLLNNMLNLEEVYCSKIPWLAYYSFGLNARHVNTIGNGYNILPYDWKSLGEARQQGFSIAAKFGNW
jgi:uncharacterized protein YycO